MSTSIQADYTLVSWLEEAQSALTSDLFLVSQYDTDTHEMISKKLPYSKLCALVLDGIDSKVSATCSAYLGDLSAKIDVLSIGLSSTSCLLDDTVSAVIKMANCIQTNKSNISAISSFLLTNVTGENGVSVALPSDLGSSSKLKIGHSQTTTATSAGLYKLGYDEHGHINSREDVTSSDLTSFFNFISGAGEGLVADQEQRILSLSAATTSTLGGIIVGDNLSMQDGRLSARDTTYSPATSSEIGLVKPGANLAVAADGTLSARDTTYTAGEGLGKYSNNKFYLKEATTAALGGIKVGVAKNAQRRIYPVTLSSSGYAYVSVDWISGNVDDFVATLHNNTLSAPDETYAVTAIKQQGGNVIALSSSDFVWTQLTALSSEVSGLTLSSAFCEGNGVFLQDSMNGVSAYAASDAAGASDQNFIDDFKLNPYLTGGEYVDFKYVNRGGAIDTVPGNFLKFSYNYVDDPLPDTSAFYVDLAPALPYRCPLYSTCFINVRLQSNYYFVLSELVTPQLVPQDITIVCLFYSTTTADYSPDINCVDTTGTATIVKRVIAGEVPIPNSNGKSVHYAIQVSGLTQNACENLLLQIDNKVTNIRCSLTIYEGLVDLGGTVV